MSAKLTPLSDHDPGYPPLLDLALARREALRLLALGALGALGLELVGCPSGPGGGGGGGGGTGLEWIPWRDQPPPPPGAPPPQRLGPVAVVVGNGPLAVTFQDGRQAALAVALVVQADDARGVNAGAAGHLAAVRAAAASLPGTVLDDAPGLTRLEQRVLEEVQKASPDLALESVQVAPALDAPPPPAQGSAPRAPAPQAPQAPSESGAPMAPPAPPPAPAAAPAPASPAPAAARPQARLWVPCSKPGCTSCGAR